MTMTPPPRRPPNPLAGELPGERIAKLLPDHPWVADWRPPLPDAWVVADDLLVSDVGLVPTDVFVHAAGSVYPDDVLTRIVAGNLPYPIATGWGRPKILAAGTCLTLIKRRSVRRYFLGGDEFTDVLDFRLHDGCRLTIHLYVDANYGPGLERTIAWNDLAIAAVVVPADHRLASGRATARGLVRSLVVAKAGLTILAVVAAH